MLLLGVGSARSAGLTCRRCGATAQSWRGSRAGRRPTIATAATAAAASSTPSPSPPKPKMHDDGAGSSNLGTTEALHAQASVVATATSAAPSLPSPPPPPPIMLDDGAGGGDLGTSAALRAHLGIRRSRDGKGLRVALIGNGGLSEPDRAAIAAIDRGAHRFAHVVRFNDMKNLRKGERTTLHVCRYRPDAWDGPYSGLSCYKRGAPLLLLGPDEGLAVPLNATFGVFPCPDGPRYEVAATLNRRVHVLPSVPESEAINKLSRYGPSTGLYIIALFQSMDEVDEIHTFGMNWAFNASPVHGHSAGEGTLVTRYCTKVTVHPTPTNEYEPPNQEYLRRQPVPAPSEDPWLPPRPKIFQGRGSGSFLMRGSRYL